MNGIRPDKSKLYYPKISAGWWLRKRAYFLFMLREWSSLFIALFLVVYLVQLYQLSYGEEAYAAFAKRLGSPPWLLFHLAALLFALYHSVTWFQSTSAVLPIRVGTREVPRQTVTTLHVGAWIVISGVILILFAVLAG